MKNNVSSTSLKSLLDSYDRDAAANSRKKISTAGGNGTAGMKTSASSLASNIKKDSGIPAITASDAKSMMNAYYKPFLMEAKVAANAEKEQIAAAKKAATTKSSEDAAEITDPYADGNKRNTDFWGNESEEKEKKTETPKKQTKIESEEQKEPGFWKKAIGVVSNGIKNVRGVGEKVNSKIDDIKKEKDDFNKSSDETFTKYNEFIQQGNNRKLIKTLDLLDEINKNQQNEVDGAADNRAELEAELKQFEPEKIQEADNLRDAYRKITGYRIADRLKNTVSGTGKTIGSGALMALDSAKQHISDSSENWGNSQLQDNRAQLENIDAQIQEMQNFGNAYVMDENGSIADENGNLAYTPEFEALLNRKQELETKIQEDAVANPVSKDTSGYKLYQSAQEDLARSDLGLSDTAKTLKGAATSAAENLAIAAVSPAAVLPILSMQGAAGSMGEDIANEVPAGTALVKGAAKFAAGYAINSIGVEQMLNTMGVDGARNTIASQIVKSIKSNSALAQSNPVFYAALAGAGDNGLQSFAEYWADRAIDLATNTAQPKSMEQLLTESLSEMGSGALGGAFTGLAGSAVNAGRQAYANQQNAQQQMIENAQQAAQQEEAPFDLPAANLEQVEDLVELDPLATGDNISPVDPGVTVSENATAQNAAAREVIANLTTGTDGGNGNTNKTAVSKNATVQNPIAQANEDILNDGLLEHSGDGGYGANTVGAAESKYDNAPGRIVQSQSNSIQQSLRDGGATAGEAEMLTDNLTHEQISLKKQTERAKQLIDEVGISGIVEEYSDIVSKGGTLNDEQSATAVTALEELQKSIKGGSTDEAEKMEAMIQRDRLMKAVSANNTTMGRALGYQGNKVKSGIDYATVAHGAVDKIVDKTIESHGGEKAVKETEAKVKQAVENAKIEAADNAIAEIEKQIADAESNLKDAKDRLNKAQKEERQTIRKAARRAVKELIGNNNLREMVKQSNGDVNLLRQYVMRILTEQYGITEKSAIKAADTVYRIYSDLVSEAIDKNMRQLLPELYKIPKTTQPNQHSAVEKFIEIAKMGQYTSEDVKALVASKWGITGLSTEQTNRIIELGDEMAEMPEKNSKAYWDKKAEMEDIIADGMGGGTWTDALASWPYVSMLSGIPKTGSKNVIGNVVLGGMTKVKNATVRPFLEFAANKFSGGKYERTTSNMLLDSKKQQRRSAAYQAYIENAYGLLKSPGKRDTTGALNNATFGNTTQDIVKNAQSNRKVFANKAGIIGKAAQKLADVENAVYSAQDEYGTIGTLKMFSFLPEQSRIRQKVEGFMTSHADKTGKKGKIGLSGVQNQFVDALSREMAAHNIDTYDQLMANRELADQMIQRAAKQANEATLHDVNAFSSHVMDISRAGGIVGKALNPFAKTSANIAVRGAEYSPFGAIEAVAKAKNGDYTTAIDALSKSITGTALMTLGALAFSNGLITIKDDDGDKDRYEKNTSGKQKYSIEIGQFLRDLGVTDAPDTVSVSLESMSVGALPFFMGAGIAEGMTDDDKASIIGNALLSLWDPLADMTLLSGLTDLVQSIQNSTDANAAVGTAIENILMGYVGEYIPTGVKQVGRAASQPTRKSYYSDKDDSLSRSIDFDLTGMRNWIPGLGGEDYVDQLGRTQNSVGGNFFGRLAYNTLSPVTINYSKPSEVDDFLDFVYEQTKKDSVYPDMPTSHAKTEVWNGTEKESYRLSKTEMTTFAKASGKATEEMLKSLEDLGGILDMGGDNIADIQSDLYATARNIGYQEALGDRYAGGESDSMKKNMDVYDQYGTDGLVKYLAGKKAFSSIKNSENVSADAKDYAEVLDGLTPAMVSKYMETDKKLYQAYKEHGTKAMAAYERASDRYSEIRDNNGKYTDALLSLDDLSAEEMGYIYSLHSSDTAKVSYLYDYFSDSKASKLSYWFMRYSAAGLEDNKQATRTAWANKYISDAWERQTFLYLYKTAVKDWKIS